MEILSTATPYSIYQYQVNCRVRAHILILKLNISSVSYSAAATFAHLPPFPAFLIIPSTALPPSPPPSQNPLKFPPFHHHPIPPTFLFHRPDDIAAELSQPLLADAQIPVVQRLSLNFSHVTPNPVLVRNTLNVAPDAGRAVLGFLEWLRRNPSFALSDETISYLVDYFGRRKDFKAIDEILSECKGRVELGDKKLACLVDRIVRAGRAVQVVEFFDRMEKELGSRGIRRG
ncbi:hypothetical protein MLD38_012502 [Melastoma candidum]|uniref:Uncharacterized protein n=1 Tax=Melastoma candidum TaxID=119954 RepID=A0ACB9R6K7_9MYRT|nr:hypothetical protein MLD38_012502 [Melastoma candidum]